MSCPSIGQKWFLDCPTCFGQVKIVLVGSKYLFLGPNHFHHVQIRLGPGQNDLDPTKSSWTPLNDWYSTKMIRTVKNHFGPIEGQGKSCFEIQRFLNCLL